MMLTLFFWIVGGLAALLVVAAWISAMQRSREREQANAETQPMYASGVFSLIRKSPKDQVLARMPSPEVTATLLGGVKDPQKADENRISTYLGEWQRVADLCIHNIELGDREGVQTYRYEVPARCGATCKAFGGDTYVTREQLHKNAELIPPFHLGCGCIIVAKAAWQGGASSGGWSPLLPINGAYPLPDWRTVVPL
jgi:hypothetical protein